MSVRRSKEPAHGSPGFYMALGDRRAGRRPGKASRSASTSTCARKARLRLVAGCTRLLNDARIPFALKVVDHPTGTRDATPRCCTCDGAASGEARGRAAHDRRRRAAPTCTAMRPPSRARSRRASPSPSMRPASARASGRVAAGCSPRASSWPTSAACPPPDRLDAVARRFAEHGLDLDSPYLSRAPPSAMRSDEPASSSVAGGLAHGSRGRRSGTAAAATGSALPPGRDPRAARGARRARARPVRRHERRCAVPRRGGPRLDDDGLRATALGAIRLALDHAHRIRPELATACTRARRRRVRGGSGRRAAGLRAGAGGRARELLADWRADAPVPRPRT